MATVAQPSPLGPRLREGVAPLPYGIGHLGLGWYAAMAGLLAVVAWGLYAYSIQYAEGEIVTGMRDVGTMGGAAWGLYIAFVVYFVGVSFAGITTAALIRLFNLTFLKPVSRVAELLTVISLILAGLSILADLGQPLRGIANLFLYARPQSPFFGTFTLVITGYLFASLVYFYLESRRDAALCARVPSRLQRFFRLWAAGYGDTPAERTRRARVSFLLALAIIPLLVTAHSTLGFVFGLQIGRPGWFSALQAPGFVVLAGISGIGLLIAYAALMRVMLGERERLSLDVFLWLGKVMMVLTAVYLYFVLVDWLTTTYQGQQHEVELTTAMLTGQYALVYWASVGSFLLAFVLLAAQFLSRRHSLAVIVLCSVLVNIGAVGKRYLIVVPSQLQGTLLPYLPGSYSPTWVEYSVVAGFFALGTLIYFLFIKVFPILDIPESEPEFEQGA